MYGESEQTKLFCSLRLKQTIYFFLDLNCSTLFYRSVNIKLVVICGRTLVADTDIGN